MAVWLPVCVEEIVCDAVRVELTLMETVEVPDQLRLGVTVALKLREAVELGEKLMELVMEERQLRETLAVEEKLVDTVADDEKLVDALMLAVMVLLDVDVFEGVRVVVRVAAGIKSGFGREGRANTPYATRYGGDTAETSAGPPTLNRTPPTHAFARVSRWESVSSRASAST